MPSSCGIGGSDHSMSLAEEDPMAERNRKKTYLILIAVLLVILLITFI